MHLPEIEEYSVTASAKDIHEVITQQQIDKTILIGHCSGGMITLKYYLQHPEKVAGLVFVATEFFFQHKREADRDHIQHYVNLLKEDLPNTLKLVTESSFCKKSIEEHPELLDAYNWEMAKTPPEATIKMFDALLHLDLGRFSQEQLRQIKVFTLLIWGSDDVHTGLDKAEYLQENIPQCRLAVITDSGHMPMMEQPSLFNKLLTDFVRQCL